MGKYGNDLAADTRKFLFPQENFFQADLGRTIDLPEITKTVAVHYLEREQANARGNKTRAAPLLGFRATGP